MLLHHIHLQFLRIISFQTEKASMGKTISSQDNYLFQFSFIAAYNNIDEVKS